MLVSSFSDITKRKQTEEALHELSARLLQLQDEERRRMGRNCTIAWRRASWR